MSNPKNTGIKIVLDRERTMSFDFNSLAALEEKLGRSMLEEGAMNFKSVTEVRFFVWASLLKEDPVITVEQAGAMITPDRFAEITSAVLRAQGVDLPPAPEVKEGTEDPTPQAAAQ